MEPHGFFFGACPLIKPMQVVWKESCHEHITESMLEKKMKFPRTKWWTFIIIIIIFKKRGFKTHF